MHPIVYIPSGAGFLPPTVLSDALLFVSDGNVFFQRRDVKSWNVKLWDALFTSRNEKSDPVNRHTPVHPLQEGISVNCILPQ